MNSQMTLQGSARTFGGVIMASAMAMGASAVAEPVRRAHVVAIAPFQKAVQYAGGVSVAWASEASDPTIELASAFEAISKAQKPLEEEFSNFLAKNLWDLL